MMTKDDWCEVLLARYKARTISLETLKSLALYEVDAPHRQGAKAAYAKVAKPKKRSKGTSRW